MLIYDYREEVKMMKKDSDNEFTSEFILNLTTIIAGSVVAVVLIIAGYTAHENTMKKEALVSGVGEADVICTFSKSIHCKDTNKK